MGIDDFFKYSDIEIEISEEFKQYSLFVYRVLFIENKISGLKRDIISGVMAGKDELVVLPFGSKNSQQNSFCLVRSTEISRLSPKLPRLYGQTSDIPTILLGHQYIPPHTDVKRKSSLNKLIWADPNMRLYTKAGPVDLDRDRSWFFNVEYTHWVININAGFGILTISSSESFEDVVQRT